MAAEKALYFIAVVPPEPILGELQDLKERLSREYSSRAALKSPPHITLHMPFQFRDDRITRVEEVLTSVANDLYNFQLGLKGFDAFPPRVIFVDVEESSALRKLQSDVQNMTRRKLNIFNARYKDRGFHPHLTVLFRDLKKSEFLRAWPQLREEEISYSFDVTEFSLLRHNGRHWEQFRKFELKRT